MPFPERSCSCQIEASSGHYPNSSSMSGSLRREEGLLLLSFDGVVLPPLGSNKTVGAWCGSCTAAPRLIERSSSRRACEPHGYRWRYDAKARLRRCFRLRILRSSERSSCESTGAARTPVMTAGARRSAAPRGAAVLVAKTDCMCLCGTSGVRPPPLLAPDPSPSRTTFDSYSAEPAALGP